LITYTSITRFGNNLEKIPETAENERHALNYYHVEKLNVATGQTLFHKAAKLHIQADVLNFI